MALKFTSTPVKRRPRKGLLLRASKPRRIVQDYAAIDQFGELAERKRQAAARARAFGHDMAGWHQRPNDPAGRWNSFCHTCNKAAVVCTEAPEGIPDIYGHALTDQCRT